MIMKMFNPYTQESSRLPLKITVPKPRPKTGLPAGVAPDVMLVMDSFPKIGDNIMLMWGCLELKKYLCDLIVNERGIHPSFPPEIATALMRIQDEHSKLFPDITVNAWDSVIY
jgi:hypothetical protein